MKDSVKLSLTENEAIVLFDFLSRFSSENKLKIEDQAEERVLWNLCCDLEKVLTQPFQKNYIEKLAEARNALRDKE